MFPRDELRGQPVFLSRVSNIPSASSPLWDWRYTGDAPKSQGRNALDDPAAGEELVVRSLEVRITYSHKNPHN